MSNINGIDNEFNFVISLNRKRISELSPLLKNLIYDLFKSGISEDDYVTSWRNHYKQKTDVFIKINGIIKGLSIKKGSRNSVHVEPITSFIHFLIKNNIPKEVVCEYLKYNYADGTTNGKGVNRISAEEYKMQNQDKIDLINKYFSDENFVKACIDRFVVQGTNCRFKIDALVFGEVNNFVFLNIKDIYKVIFMHKNDYSSGVHVSCLSVQPQTRNLNYNELYEKKRYCVQIKWFSLEEDILKFLNIERVV